MAKKKRSKELKGFSIQFLPYREVRDLESNQRIKKILDFVLGNNILVLQGRLNPSEETRLIEDTMAMVGHVKDFKGVELAVISGEDDTEKKGPLQKLRTKLANILYRGEVGSMTIIGPAHIVKEIKRNPKKIELLLNNK